MAQPQTDVLARDRASAAMTSGNQPRASRIPRVLRVETGWNNEREMRSELFVTLLDYNACTSVPRLWRAVERGLRLDIYLASLARRAAPDYDIVWAGSEKVALPLTLMGVSKPLVVTLHYPQATGRAALLKGLNMAQRWAAIGYVSADDREFFVKELKIPPDRLFPIQSIKLGRFTPAPDAKAECILSLGVTKRDYRTLVRALQALPGYETEVFVSSRFGDSFRGSAPEDIPAWVHFRKPIPDQELVSRYQHSRFVVVTLEDTMQSTAGINVVLEASASGKAVIATRTHGTPAYLIDGETGILVPPNDVPALRAAIEKLWTQPELARSMGARGRSFVEQQFNPKSISEGIRATLLRVHAETSGG